MTNQHDEDVLCPACFEHTSRGNDCCGMLEPCDCDECTAQQSEACMPGESDDSSLEPTPCDHEWVKRGDAPGVYCSICETEYEEEGL